MHPLRLDPTRLRRVVCLGAHCDDIEIGAGGSLSHWSEQNPATQFDWIIFSGDDEREAESREAARRIHGPAKHSVRVLRHRMSYFPAEYAAVKDSMESLRSGPEPDLVLTHRLEDRHQDHRVIAELTWNTFRRHTILEYEIPKYEGDLGHPNLFQPLTATQADAKVGVLMECFPSQLQRSWFTANLFRAHLALRGIECGSASGYAEGLYARKLTLT